MAATEAVIRRILKGSKTIAVVGCSREKTKAAHLVPGYMQRHGYSIIPVNPSANTILGEKSHARLSDVREPIDIVVVFRPGTEAPAIVEEALKLNPKPKMIWLQEGIRSDNARTLAEEAGIQYVEDRCIMKEHLTVRRSLK